MNLIWTIVIMIPLVLFLIWFYCKPTSLLTGFFSLLFLINFGILIITTLEKVSQRLALIIAMPVIILAVLLTVFGIYALIIGLFWNERVLLKYERLSFSNLLPLIVASFLLVLEIGLFIGYKYSQNDNVLALLALISSIYFYFGLIFLLYGITAILYNFSPFVRKIDYIIVLGAGLNQDKVTPLLAARIEAGVKLYHRQMEKYNHTPIMILSGGKGDDELISEAQAMANYLDEKGYHLKQVYLEEKSTNTSQNIGFSEKLAQQKDQIDGFKTKKIVIATNNYHLLRAGKIAQYRGIRVRGTGAKTRLYYLPTAFMREYVGYLSITKKKHFLVILLLLLSSLIVFLFK